MDYYLLGLGGMYHEPDWFLMAEAYSTSGQGSAQEPIDR